MKALTVCQPYAHLITVGAKFVENRTWHVAYRGWLAVHAGSSTLWMRSEDWHEFPAVVFGGFVAVARLVGVMSVQRARAIARREPEYAWLADHPHLEGPMCWIFNEVRPLTRAVACSGRRGLWDVPADLVREMRGLVAPVSLRPENSPRRHGEHGEVRREK